MRAAILLLGAVLAAPSNGAPWMTGARLLGKLEPVSPQAVPWTPKSNMSREELAALHSHANLEYVRGYVEALHDATEGRVWCYDARHEIPNPEDFWNESRWGLANLPVDQRKRNSAELLPEIWRAKWPCPGRRP